MFSRFSKNVISVPVLQNVRERLAAKNYCRLSFLYVVRKIFEELVNARLVDFLENLLPDSQYWFQIFLFNWKPSDSCI